MANYTRNTLVGDAAPVNPELEKIEQALKEKVDRKPDDDQPNQLETDLDMNGNQIVNLGAPTNENDAARLKDVQEAVSTGLPDQTGNAGKFLSTDGSTTSWQETGGSAANTTYDNTTSGLAATNTQDAIDEVEGRVDSSETAIVNVTNRVTTAEGEIDTLQTDTSTNTTDIANLTGRVTTAEGEIDTLQTDVANNDTDISNLQGDVSQAQTDISNLQGDVSSNDTDISNLQGSVATKADKVGAPVLDNIVTQTADGNIKNSGSSVSDFATATQGSKADTALQSGDNISTLTNDSNYLTGIGSQSINDLSDVDTTGKATGRVLEFDASGNMIVGDKASGGATSFVGLSDTPSSYTGQGSKIVAVNVGENALEFISVSGAGLVDSVFGRVGDVVAQASDYDASQIDNDSGVTGATVAAALDTLDAAIPDVTGKMDKVGTPVLDNFISQDATGNAKDSGVGASDFATSTQGALADSAVQPGDNVSDLVNDANYEVVGHTHTLSDITDAGTAAAADVTTSATDNTVGSVATFVDSLGIFGLGSTDSLPLLTDLQVVDDTGFYSGNDTTLNNPASPNPVAVLNFSRSAGRTHQLISSDNKRLFIQTETGGGWASNEVWTSDNLVKTTSATDNTDGSVVTVDGSGGWFGLGGTTAPASGDADALTETGFYRVDAASITATSSYAADGVSVASGSTLLHIGFNTTNWSQMLYTHSGDVVYHRINDGGSVSTWRAMWDDANLVKQSDPYDNSPGVILKIEGTKGSFGLGATNMDDLTDDVFDHDSTGLRFFSAAAPNNPATGAAYVATLGANAVANSRFDIAASNNLDEFYLGGTIADVGQTWEKIWHTGQLDEPASDYWQSSLANTLTPGGVGYLGTQGSFRTSLTNNVYRNDGDSVSFMGVDGNTTTGAILEFDNEELFWRTGAGSGTSLADLTLEITTGGVFNYDGNAVWHEGNLVKTTDPTDATDGSVLQVGDGGILWPIETDSESALEPDRPAGLYQYKGTMTDLPGSNAGQAIVVNRGRGGSALEGFTVFSDQGSDDIYAAKQSANVYGSWFKFWTEQNLVKTASVTDNTDGSVVTVDAAGGGWFGLGARDADPYTLTSVDLNTIVETSFAYCVSCSNIPGTQNGYLITETSTNTGFHLQRYIEVDGGIYHRVEQSGVWGDWVEVLTTSNSEKSPAFIDCRNYITDYTGATDQRANLQAAFDAAVSQGVNKVYLGDEGVILAHADAAGATVEIPSTVTEVWGGGPDMVLYYTDANASGGRSDCIKVANSYTGTELYMHDFCIRGYRQTTMDTSSGTPAFGLNGSNGGTAVRLERLRFEYCRNQAMSFTNWGRVHISNCTLFRNGRGGIGTRACNEINIHHNQIKGNGDDSIFCLQNDATTAEFYPHNINITNNNLVLSQGIKVYGAINANISNNTIHMGLNTSIFVGTNVNLGSLEGRPASAAVRVNNNTITDHLNREELDTTLTVDSQYIFVESSDQTGATGGVATVGRPNTDGTIEKPQNWLWSTETNDDDGAFADAGSWYIEVSNNTILSTLPDDANLTLSDYGGLDYWPNTTGESVVATVLAANVPSLLQVPGIDFAGPVQKSVVRGGIISPYKERAIGFTNNNYDYAVQDLIISDLALSRSVDSPLIEFTHGVMREFDVTIRNCSFDVDPYQESSNRISPLDGGWNNGSLQSVGIDLEFVTGATVTNCEFRNCYKPMEATLATTLVKDCLVYAEPAATGWNSGNKGVGFIDFNGAGYTTIVVDSDPTAATYRDLITMPRPDNSSKPSSGTYVQGFFVKNREPAAASPTVYGWLRLTTGTGHVAGTDWKELSFA